MNEDDLTEIELLLGAASSLPPLERARLLDERCASRPDLLAEVESLLAAHDLAGSAFLERGGEPFESALVADLSGRTIGGFRLIERIGAGGMGVVYRAEREGDFTHRVALKLVDAPLRHPEALRRFRTERQILAALQHPHIVALVDGGQTADGHAYLVMEYVEGVPITAYCHHRRLSLDDRLTLFREVCGAVHHAHLHSVVHRDLKPGNILVTPDGLPKLLDFGISKLLDHPAAGPSATATGLLRPLTPNYASPEQLRGLDVTMASDVYALGVLLYEILTGGVPYDTTDRPLDEVLRLVLEREPPPPSRAAAAFDAAALPYDRRALRGDLDAIVLMAMSKEPPRRYDSARALADDIARYQSGHPVLAREPALGYLLRIAARRHRAAAAAALVSLTALLGALGVSAWQTGRAVAARDRAEQRFGEVRQLANALILPIHDAVRPLAGSTPVLELIVSTALTYLERLSAEAGDDPELRLELAKAYHRIGSIQGRPGDANLGDLAGAIASLTKGIDLLAPLISTGQADLAVRVEFGRAHITLSSVAWSSGDRDAGSRALSEAMVIAESLVQENPAESGSRHLLGSAYFQRAQRTPPDEALEAWRRAGDVFEELLAREPESLDAQRNMALVHKYIGGTYNGTGDFDRALEHYSRALELDAKRVARTPEDRRAQLDLAIDLGEVASINRAKGDLVKAADGYERSLQIRRQLAEADQADVYARGRLAYVLDQLGWVYSDLARHELAISHAREAVRLNESLVPISAGGSVTLANSLLILARAQAAAGKRAEACDTARRGRSVLQSDRPPKAVQVSARAQRLMDDADRKVKACASP